MTGKHTRSLLWNDRRWFTEETRMLCTWLIHNMRTGHDVLMPCKDKRPMFKHSECGDRWWTWEDAFEYRDVSGTAAEVGVLLHDLCVVDVDDMATATLMESQFPVLTHVPSEDTRRGRHYFFARSRKADTEGYYCSHSARINHVDFKTRHANGTRSLVIVAPSSSKKWVRRPWDRDALFIPIPDALLDAVALPQSHAPHVDLHLLHDNSVVRVRNNEFWRGSCMLEPVMSGEFGHMTLPDWVTPKMVAQMQAFMEGELVGDHVLPESRDDLVRIHSLANMMGMSKVRIVDALDALRPTCMFGALRDHKRMSVQSSSSLHDVTHGFGGNMPVNQQRDSDKRLFHTRPPVTARGQVGLMPQRIPAYIQKLLERHAGTLVLAGGGALHATYEAVTTCGDYDMYIIDNHDLHQNDSQRWACDVLLNILHERLCERTGVEILFVSQNALTARIHSSTEHVVQIMTKTYASVEDVLNSFDFDPCKVAVYHHDTSLKAIATQGWISSVSTASFCIDPKRWHASTALRALKYYEKGFDVYIPGLVRGAQRTHADLLNLMRTSSSPTGLHDLMLVEGEVRARDDCTDRRACMKRDIQPVVNRWKQRFYACSVYEDQPCTTFLGAPVVNLCYKLCCVMRDVWRYLGNQAHASATLWGLMNLRTTMSNCAPVKVLESIAIGETDLLFDTQSAYSKGEIGMVAKTLRAMLFHPDKAPHTWRESDVDLGRVHHPKKYRRMSKNCGL